MDLVATRKVDSLCRLVIPSELKMKLGLEEGSALDIFSDGEQIILKKAVPSCKLCNGNDDVDTGLSLCRTCIDKVKNY